MTFLWHDQESLAATLIATVVILAFSQQKELRGGYSNVAARRDRHIGDS